MSTRAHYFGLAAIVVAVGGGLAAVIAVRSYLREVNEFFPVRRPVSVSAGDVGLLAAESVEFADSTGATLRGWYIRSKTGASVVLVHGAGGDRTSLAPEATALVSRDMGVLVFDLPGHGASDGDIHWNEGEFRAVQAAIDFVSAQPDVDSGRIGALGFSLGGAVLSRVAATDPRPRAVVFAGTPSNQVEQVRLEYSQWGPLSQLPALFALRQRGFPLDGVQPRDVIGSISPRPVLIVSGTDDDTVPLSLAQQLYASARQPKEILVVDGARHGGYERVPGAHYLERITAFFESHV